VRLAVLYVQRRIEHTLICELIEIAEQWWIQLAIELVIEAVRAQAAKDIVVVVGVK
jgi:hypothetical protein